MKLKPSGYAWVGLVLYVTGVDVLLLRLKRDRGSPYRSMSEAFDEALKHPWKRWPIIVSWIILTLHLFGGFIPKRFENLKYIDPIGFIANMVAEELE
jgi:hypothetical protein